MVQLSNYQIAKTNCTLIVFNRFIDCSLHIRYPCRENNHRIGIFSGNARPSNEFITVNIVVFRATNSKVSHANRTATQQQSSKSYNKYFFHFSFPLIAIGNILTFHGPEVWATTISRFLF
nr:MAG TPA_asm: hypothetical protein [Caudoviricetes sp.]